MFNISKNMKCDCFAISSTSNTISFSQLKEVPIPQFSEDTIVEPVAEVDRNVNKINTVSEPFVDSSNMESDKCSDLSNELFDDPSSNENNLDLEEKFYSEAKIFNQYKKCGKPIKLQDWKKIYDLQKVKINKKNKRLISKRTTKQINRDRQSKIIYLNGDDITEDETILDSDDGYESEESISYRSIDYKFWE